MLLCLVLYLLYVFFPLEIISCFTCYWTNIKNNT
jgi:hypothetical protein